MDPRAWLRALLYGLAGLAFAVGLTLAAYTVAGGGAAEPAVPVRVPDDLAPTRATGSPSSPPSVGPTAGEDISGPCDEAEHADDPRCVDGGEEEEDRSGSNSWSGND